MTEYGVECRNCGTVNDNTYRCDECGKDLVDETGSSQGGDRYV